MKQISTRIGVLFFLLISASCIRATAQQVAWAAGMGGKAANIGRSVTSDLQGYIYTTGSFQDTSDFDPGPNSFNLIPNGGYDIFVSKLSPSGDFIWAFNIGGKTSDEGYGIVSDNAGHIYVAGYYADTVDFDPDPNNTVNLISVGTYDIFVAKYDTSGALVWARSMGGKGTDYGYTIAIDKAGNIYTSGYFRDTVDFNPGTGAADTFFLISQGADIFISKLDPNGNFIWAKRIGSTGADYGQSLAADAHGYFYLTGYFNGTVNFDPAGNYPLQSKGSTDAYLARFDTSGNLTWAKNMGGTGADQGLGVATDPWGNAYATGYILYPSWFKHGQDSVMLPSPPAYKAQDIYVVKWDSAGTFQWVRMMGGKSGDYGNAIATDRAGNVYTTGRYRDTGYFNPADPASYMVALGSSSADEIFVSKMDPNGNFVWAATVSSRFATDRGNGIHVDNSGNVLVTGQFGDTADFDPATGNHTIISKGSTDIFVLKFACTDTSTTYTTATTDCHGYEFYGTTYLESGHYRIHLAAVSGCDSTIALDLTVVTDLQVQISVNEYELSTTTSYQSYQWFRNDTLIPGATNRTHTVTSNGGYHVAVTDENGCMDTSNIYPVNNVAVQDYDTRAAGIYVYPNPVQDIIYITSPFPVTAELTGIDGRFISRTENAGLMRISDLPKGMYLLRILDTDDQLLKVEKLIRQ